MKKITIAIPMWVVHLAWVATIATVMVVVLVKSGVAITLSGD
ncbi:hypothetical protein ACGFI3_24115 [Nonomuraea wenchangensis]